MPNTDKYRVDAFDRPNGRGSGGLLGGTTCDTIKAALKWGDGVIEKGDGWLSRTQVLVVGKRHGDLSYKTYVKTEQGWEQESRTEYISGEGMVTTFYPTFSEDDNKNGNAKRVHASKSK